MAALVAPVVATAPAAVAATSSSGSGTSYSTAGASCWGIKQAYPSSADGAYWIQTPQLVDPLKVYCDMTTGGGGWELVGRGRQGWTWSGTGQGSATTLASTPTGTSAFSVAALSDETIDGLLNGTRLDSLPDGVQLRRATNHTSFANPQLVTLSMSNRAAWSWAFGGGELFSSIAFNGSASGNPEGSSGAGNTADVSVDNGSMALFSWKMSQQNYQDGFAYGGNVTGSTSATDYFYDYSGRGYAVPFTQVWIRPQIANSVSYPTIPSSGTAATSLSPLMSTTVQSAPWGVTGLMKSYGGESTMQVETMQQLGSAMYVGGLFSTVQNSTGSTQVAQPYLAAFDLSGNWISSFRPTFNGEVWTVVPYQGELLVGGDFTSVNGVAEAGIALLDPSTGAVDTSWTVGVTGSTARVRDLAVQGNYVYVGGSFTQLGPSSGRFGHNKIGRVVISTGKVDQTWNPNFNDGAVYQVQPSAQGDRVYAEGTFTQLNGSSQSGYAVIDATSGQEVSGLQPFVYATGSAPYLYQQDAVELGNTVWVGGSQHILTAYNRSDLSAQASFLTRGPTGFEGGDIAKVIDINGVLYAGCHCGDYVYSNTYDYSSNVQTVSTASNVTRIDWMYAVDEATQQVEPAFNVIGLKSANGNGVWAFAQDTNGCMWFGGDFTAVGSTWLGSFGRVCGRDTTPPTTPTGLTVTAASAGPKLTWTASSDNSGTAVSYEVLRNDRVVALTTSTTYTDSGAHGTYYVRALDATGNRSASTAGAAG